MRMDDSNIRLQEARKRAGFKTAADAIRRFGWKPSTYRSHENGQTPVPPDVAKDYARAYEVSPAWLLYGAEAHDKVTGSVKDSGLTQPERVDNGANRTVLDERPTEGFLGSPSATPKFPALPYSDRRIPVLGLGLGGERGSFILNGKTINYVPCPPGLEHVPDVFAIYAAGDSMEPRYFEGELLYIDPNPTPKMNDFVLIEMQSKDGEPGDGFIKWFKGFTPTQIKLEQFNPPEKFNLKRDKIKKISVIYSPRG